MKKYLLSLWLMSTIVSLAGQGGNMRFGIEGRIANATGIGIEGAKIEVHILPADSANLVSNNTRLRQWLAGKTDEIYTTETNSEGLFSGVLSREVFQALRAKGISFREALIIVKADATGYEMAVNLVKPEMQRTESGMTISLGLTTLLRAEERMDAVEIRTKAIEMKGDTAEMNASNYKVNPDASAEDLVRKLPGVTQRNGEIEAQGEKVVRVLVDGKPYFGEDPKAALKNVPADAISKIQVYDARTAQSQFTGFDDGNTTKTMNIITKSGFKNGQFGKFYGGLGRSIDGTGDLNKYKTGANYNKFNGDRRFSILLQSNNINEQNFAFEDVSGFFRGGDFGKRGMGDFSVSGNEGITQSSLFGLNYSDKWGKKWDVSGSYFFSDANNTNKSQIDRVFITGGEAGDLGLRYTEEAEQSNQSQQHRFSSRLEWNIDTNDRIIMQPRLTFQNTAQDLPTRGISQIADYTEIISLMNNLFTNKTNSVNGAFEVNWLHAFDKRGRSLAIELIPSYNASAGRSSLDNRFYRSLDTSIRKQETRLDQGVYALATKVEFTEPLDSFNSVLFTYETNFNQNASDRLNYIPNLDGAFTQMDTLLSSQFENGYSRHAGGMRFQRIKKGITLIAGLDAQLARLEGTQTFPVSADLNRRFFSILPQLTLRSGTKGANGIRVFYRTSNNAPSVTQLQDVINNSNPLQLTSGNANLVQDYQHRLFSRYFNMDAKSGRMFFAFIRGTASMNALTTLTQIASSGGGGILVPTGDSVYLLRPGTQLSKPVNIDGAFTIGSRLNWSRPVMKGKLNVNVGVSLDYRETPSLIQIDFGPQMRNTSKNPGLTFDLGLGSNISEQLDFNITSATAYNQVLNTLQSSLNQTYWIQRTGLQVNWMPGGKWVINSDINHQLFTGFQADFDQSIYLWNAGLGRKFGEKNEWDFRVQLYDILNQNRSVVRNVNETFFEDVRTTVLTRYVMVQMTYNLRAFKGKSEDQESNDAMHKMYYQRMYKR
jgi:hypothetical protein